jgi:hypothetical protein
MTDKIDLNFKIAAMEKSTSSRGGFLFKQEDMLVINKAADSLEYLENQNKLLKLKLRQLTNNYKQLIKEKEPK